MSDIINAIAKGLLVGLVLAVILGVVKLVMSLFTKGPKGESKQGK